MIQGARVLVCDDSKLALLKLKKVYEELGMVVAEVYHDGQQAIEAYKAKRGEIDLVSLDLVMPGMDGLEVLAELKKIDPGVRVIILSSIVQPEIEAKARELGAAGVLEKPYDPERIRQVAEAALGTRP